jgi:hypothetical protein
MHDEKDTDSAAHDAPIAPREEQSNMMMDDINIPMVATGVAFFAVFLAVLIVSLQAWFYTYQAAERRAKTLPQESPESPLGSLLQMQRKELHDPPGIARKLPGLAAGTAPGASTAKAPDHYRMPIDAAMQGVMNEYAQGAR